MASKYREYGVDVAKRNLQPFKRILRTAAPNAFCVVFEDPDFPRYLQILHTDGAGSKPVQCYLNWKVTDDIRQFAGLAQDVLAVNLNDVACVGAKPSLFVDYIALNPFKIPEKELITCLAAGFKQLFAWHEGFTDLKFAGGETAHLPDQTQTLDISGAISGRVRRDRLIDGSKISEGDIIIGLHSGGRTKYEKVENSGIMCNGITLARHSLMSKEYTRAYPEISPPSAKPYRGKFHADEYLDELGMTVGEAITSPTRIYWPAIKDMLSRGIETKAVVHNSGGGLTKCLNTGSHIHYVKNDLMPPDAIFKLIQQESGESWRNMYQDFNMGVGCEIVAPPDSADEILTVCDGLGLSAQRIGYCTRTKGSNQVTIETAFGEFRYRK